MDEQSVERERAITPILKSKSNALAALTPSFGIPCNRSPMSTILELSDICAEQNPNPAEQWSRIVALLTAGADMNASDKNGVTALHHAVRFRSPIAVKALIEHGANVNCTF